MPLKTKQIRNMAINPVAFSLRLADPCKLISVASCGLRVSRTKVNALLSPTFVSKPALSASCGSAAPPAVEPLLLTCYPWCVVCAGAPQVRGVRSCVVCAAASWPDLGLAWPKPVSKPRSHHTSVRHPSWTRKKSTGTNCVQRIFPRVLAWLPLTLLVLTFSWERASSWQPPVSSSSCRRPWLRTRSLRGAWRIS